MTTADARPSGFQQSGSDVALLARRQNAMMGWGEVIGADYDLGKYLVRMGSPDPLPGDKGGRAHTQTYWVGYTTSRASDKTRSWNPLDIGEQVFVQSPSGDIANALITDTMPCADYSPHCGKDPDLRRWAYGESRALEECVVEDVHRKDLYKHIHLPDGGRCLISLGKDFLGGAAIDATPERISLRVKNTSLVIDQGKIELQVEGGKSVLRLTASEMISLIENISVIQQTAAKVDMQINGKGQVKITETEILNRVEETVMKMLTDSILNEIVSKKVKALLDGQGVTHQTEAAASYVTVSGNTILNSNGSEMAMKGGMVTWKLMDYAATNEAVPAPAYPATTPPPVLTPPTVPKFTPPARPEMIPGNNPGIPPVEKAIRA